MNIKKPEQMILILIVLAARKQKALAMLLTGASRRDLYKTKHGAIIRSAGARIISARKKNALNPMIIISTIQTLKVILENLIICLM